jgi:hypothetical protein
MAKKAAKKTLRKKAAVKRRKAVQPSRRLKRPAGGPRMALKAKAKARPTSRKTSTDASLGRPLVRADEKLYMLFKQDYHARQIFEFLRVETVGELEQFSPRQVLEILSAPVRETLERIRERLAEYKRHLRDDTPFARDYLSTHPSDGSEPE